MRNTLFFAIFLSFSSLYASTEFNSSSLATTCLACNIPDGLLVSDLNGASATLSWNAVTGATGYTVEVEDEQNNPSTFHIEANVSNASYQVTGLQAGVLYKFNVRSRCGGDKSDWSNWLFFTVGNGGGGSADCGVPTGLSVSIAGGVANLGWAVVPGAIKYTIEVEDEQNSPSTFHLEDSSFTNSYTLAGLQPGVWYKFKVRAHCIAGQSDWSAWVFFNGSGGNGSGGGIGGGSGNCDRPTGPQATNITANAALLSWNAVPGAASYFLEIEREQAGASQWQITQMVTNNSFLLTGLTADTRYKFKVRTNCTGGGHSNWTKWRKFKTAPSFTDPTGENNLSVVVGNRESQQLEFEEAIEVSVWPNPAQFSTTVHLRHLNLEPTTLRMFDLSGRLIQEQLVQQDGGSSEIVLHTSGYSNGIYLLQIQSGTQTRTSKLVIAH